MSYEQNSSIKYLSTERSSKDLNAFAPFPKRPKHLHPEIELNKPLSPRPSTAAPRKRLFLFSVEWAWSPMHNRIDNYYLNPRRTGWLLWNNWLEDGFRPWRWYLQLMAYGNRCHSDENSIAKHLVLALWKWDAKENHVDHFHWLNDTGLLGVEDVKALAREVW